MRERRFHHRKAHVTLKASDIDRKRTRLNEQSLLPNTCLQFAPEGLVQSGRGGALSWKLIWSRQCPSPAPPQAVTNCKIWCLLCVQREQLAATDSSTAVWKSVVRSLLISPSMCAHPGILAPSDTKLAMLQLGAPLRYIRKYLATAAKTVHVRPSSTTVHNVSQRARLGKKAAA